jgi:glycosyltransferase involved in cell wall biosynthesis
VSRLLFVSPVYPSPLDRGQNVRIAQLVQACARDHLVTLVVPRPAPGAFSPELEALAERVVYVDPSEARASPGELWRLARELKRVRRPGVLHELDGYRRAMRSLDVADFDLVWVERLMLTPLFASVLHRVVVDLDDLEHRKWWRAARLRLRERPFAARVVARHCYYALRFGVAELRATRRFAAAVVASPEDEQYLRRRRTTNVWTVPNGVTLPAPHQPRTRTVVRRMVFLGNLSYDANLDALDVMRDELLPVLRREAPELSMSVVGPGCTDELRAAHPEVEFLGFVPDLPVLLRSFDLLLAPLRVGGGTKLKVLEAMANGLPVVTTPVGAEGLRLQDRVTAIVSSTPEGLVDGVLALRREPALAQRLAEQAAVLAQDFAWDQIRERMADELLQLRRGLGAAPADAAARPASTIPADDR